MSTPDLLALPADYGDPLAEARSCRAACALFDFSFVRRARLRGPRALDDVQRFCGRALAGVPPGAIRYALRRAADGAVEADLTVWRIDRDTLELMSGRGVDIEALRTACHRSTEFEDRSPDSAIFAVQGPHALRALAPLTDLEPLERLGWFRFVELVVAGVPCLVARLGYTGERGFELVAPAARAAALWSALAARARPAGFAAIDMLRIEAGLVLFSHECRVRPRAAEIGLQALVDEAEAPPRMRLVGFRAAGDERVVLWRPQAEPRPPSAGSLTVTSASWSVHAGTVLGLGFAVDGEHAPGTRLRDSAARFAEVTLTPLPWWDTRKRRPRGPWSAAERAAARFAMTMDSSECAPPSIKS